jgi:hypothetical protein
MKTKVEIEGYEIEIEFEGGVISVKAEKEDEVIEEFSIEVESAQSQGESDEDEVQAFGEFGQDEEEDFDSEEMQDEEDMQDDREGAPALESFQSFINKRK